MKAALAETPDFNEYLYEQFESKIIDLEELYKLNKSINKNKHVKNNPRRRSMRRQLSSSANIVIGGLRSFGINRSNKNIQSINQSVI